MEDRILIDKGVLAAVLDLIRRARDGEQVSPDELEYYAGELSSLLEGPDDSSKTGFDWDAHIRGTGGSRDD